MRIGLPGDDKVEELREKYPEFVYKSYSYELKNGDFHMSFVFEVGDIRFNPKIVIKSAAVVAKAMASQRVNRLENLVFHLGLAEMPSYWKATASPNIVVEAGFLDKQQIRWWHDLFIHGMGQYFFENKIDFRPKNFLKISSANNRSLSFAIANNNDQWNQEAQQILVPIGGGKDAVVTYEILKAALRQAHGKHHITPFALNPTAAQKALLKKMGQGSGIVVERTIDPKLLELNRTGYLNGHTPFSAYLAFVTTLCAALFHYTYIALSNERSSNEGNVQYLGQEINHQYSKSFAFEKKFRSYSKKYLGGHTEYFSFLRPLYELQIAKLFSSYPKYCATFLSCNEAHKTNSGKTKPAGKWCGACSKCLFVFASLYPYIEKGKLTKIFGKNLFEDKTLIPLMEELVGERNFKPFECIGTTKESLAALYLSLQRTHPPLPALLQYFRQHISKKHPQLPQESRTMLNSWNTNHALPPGLEKALKTMVE